MAMRLVMAKMCEGVGQTPSGRMTLNGLFTNVVAPSFPVLHPPFDIVVELEFETPEWGAPYRLEAILIDEDGRTAYETSRYDVAPAGRGPGVSRALLVAHVPGVVFEAPGQYRLDVTVNGKKVGEERLPVVGAAVWRQE